MSFVLLIILMVFYYNYSLFSCYPISCYFDIPARSSSISSFSGITRSAPFLVVIIEAAALANQSISSRPSLLYPSRPCSST